MTEPLQWTFAALRGSGCDVLDDRNAAAAAKWRGNDSLKGGA